MLRLHVVPASGEAFDHPVVGESLVIGRSSQADLVLEDRFLSRRHARIFHRGDAWWVEDLGTRIGTLLNGVRLETPTPVAPGDTLQIAANVLTVLAPAEASGEAARLWKHSSSTGYFRPAAEILRESRPDVEPGEQALRRYAERLKLVNEVHQALARPISLKELLDLILDRVFEHLQPEEGAILLKKEPGELYRAASRTAPALEGAYLYSRTLVHEVAEKAMAALVVDALTDERFGGARSILDSGVRSLVAAPLLDAEGCLGMIALNSRLHVRQFSAEDLELLVSLASVAALRIRNVALAEDAAERRRLEGELALARQIQVALLPARLPEVPGYELHGGNVPSRGVSGDYYEVVERLGGEECVLMIADVSGKGLAASLLTACLEALAAEPIESGLPPEEICNRVCRRLYQRTSPERFATAFLAALEPRSGRMRYANAGHNPALLVHATGGVERLAATGLPLGLLPAVSYTARETHLAPGDLLLLYTDGIVEATNPEDEEYGLDRLIEACLRHRGGSLKELAHALEADLEAFVRGVPFADDRTLVLARRSVSWP